MSIAGIYQIQSKINPSKIYIGSSIKINKRWNEHLCRLRKNTHKNNKLQNHFNKYGEADLQFSVLLGCEKEDLIRVEQYFIDSCKPWFNCTPNAGNCLGHKHSLETITKMRISGKNKNKGRKHTEETKQKIKASTKGRIRSLESIEKYKKTRLSKKTI